MRKLLPAVLAAGFALSSTAAMLATGAVLPATGNSVSVLSAAALPALADDEHGRGDRENGNGNGNSDNCVNPAGHEKGWCKHGDNNDEQGEGRHKHRHRHHGTGYGTINGTVLSANGTTAQVRLDNGQVITVNENGTQLNVGQHYTLNGCYQNGAFTLGCYAGNNYPSAGNQQISGTILSISGNTLTLVGIPPVTIDVGQALANGRTNGPLTALRHITAYGSYQNGTFVATSIQ